MDSAKAPVARKRTEPPEVRRAQILAATRKLLATKDFAKLRVSEIVEEAGLSQGAFYLHFPTKEAVVIDLARNLVAEALAALEATYDPNDGLEAGVRKAQRAYYDVCFAYSDVLESTSWGAAVGIDRLEWNAVYAPVNEFARRMMAGWQAIGVIDPAMSPDVLSWLYIDTVNGALSRLFGHSGDRVSSDYEEQILQWLLSALTGIRPGGGASNERRNG
jgi:AcrR family transcriptional regulator